MTEKVKKTYIVAYDNYKGNGYGMYRTQCTWRELLMSMNDIEPSDVGDVIAIEGQNVFIKDATDQQLIDLFNASNGAGQPYFQVFCLEDNRKVLG